MANIITAPESGIYFDGNTAGVSNFPVLTGDASGVAIQYDGYAGIKINSAATGVNYQDRFSVEGANGRLFGVSDAVTGTVFSVNDAAGLPIIEVESTADYDKITIGEYGTDALVISGSSVEIGGETAATRDWVTGQGYVTASSEQQTLDNVLERGSTSTRSMGVGSTTITTTGSSVTALKLDSSVTNDLAFNHYTGYTTIRDYALSSNRALFFDSGKITFPYNFGIGLSGATQPSEALEVKTDTDSSAIIGKAHVGYISYSNHAGFSHLDQNGANSYALLQSSSGRTYLNAANGSNISFRINNADKAIIDSSGNVGIGTTAPTQKLHIKGAALRLEEASAGRHLDIVPAVSGVNHRLTSTTTGAGFDFEYWNGSAATVMATISSGGITVAGSVGVTNIVTNRIVKFNGSILDDSVMYDDGTNIGIGTTGPSDKLEVNGNIAVKTASGNSGIKIITDNSSEAFLIMGDPDDNSMGGLAYNNSTNTLSIDCNNQERMTILSDGKVGIGTTSPSYKLDVAGNAARIGNSSQTTTSLFLTATNTAGAPARAVETVMEGYEGRGIGTFYKDTTYSGEQWFCGMNYSGNFDRWSVGYDASGGQPEYLANTLFSVKSDGNVGIGTTSPSAKLNVIGSSTIGWSNLANSYILVGTTTAGIGIDTNEIAVKGEPLYIGTIDAGDDLVFRAGGSATRAVIDGSNGYFGINDGTPSYQLDVNGTLRAVGAATFDSNVTVAGNLTVNGTTTTINSTTISVDDKNIELGSVATPTDTTADGGGITLKGATDKTINWLNTSSAWTFSDRIAIPYGSETVPSLTFSSDTDTGIYGASTFVRIVVNGVWKASIASNGITSNGFVKTGGTSSEFLKANGSVDSNTYLTTSSAAATYLGITAKAADSELLDGIDSSAFLRSNADDTYGSASNTLTIAGVVRSNNDGNTYGSNFQVSTTTKSTALYAYEVDRSGGTVGGIRIDGSVVIPYGSQSNPSLAFGSDTDTGIYGAADLLRITVGGTSRALFNASGITSSSNVYSATGGEFRNYSGVWKGTTGTTGNGFQFINSVDGTALTISSTGDVVATGSVTTEGPDGGMVMREWTGGSGYGMIGTANMTGNEYALLTNGQHTYISGGSSGNVYIRGGNNDSDPSIVVSPSAITFNGVPSKASEATALVWDGTTIGYRELGSNAFNSTAFITASSTDTLTNKTWNGNVIASAYLDADTAHLSGTQTFTGAKTFNNITAANGYKAEINESSDADNVTSNNIKYGYISNAATNKPVSGNSHYASVGRITLTHYDTSTNDDFYIRASSYNGLTSWAKIFTSRNSSGITTVGTITSGEWNGSVISSAYLDGDTAHLSGTQTFSGAKTFSSGLNITVSTSNTQLKLKRTGTATGEFNIYTNNDTLFFNNVGQSSYPMVIDDAGNVGIGTTSPSYKLHVAGESYFSGGVQVDSGNKIDFGNGNQYVTAVNDTSLTLATGGSATLTATHAGNVGIGTTSPDYELHVIGTASFTDTVAGAYFEENASHPSLKKFETGTILVMNEEGQLVPSSKADDTMVFGVSKHGYKQPIVMGAEPIKVTGPIKVGDYITTSDIPGHGKKSTQPYPFGTIIAQAMESGDGESYNIKAMIRKM